MNQEQAKAWLPLIQAVADGKKIQCNVFGHWQDCMLNLDYDTLNRMSINTFRIKPREFKNFELPWDFIDKRLNFATYTSCNGEADKGVILYDSKPKFIGGISLTSGWSSMGKLCTWMALEIKQEGINETDWLACRNPEDIEVQS